MPAKNKTLNVRSPTTTETFCVAISPPKALGVSIVAHVGGMIAGQILDAETLRIKMLTIQIAKGSGASMSRFFRVAISSAEALGASVAASWIDVRG